MRTIAALLVLAVVAVAKDPDAARAKFLAELHNTYNYLPADVTKEVREQKLEEMKSFFKFFGPDAKTYLPYLREALRAKDANPWFCFDGAGLLVTHSKTTADYRLAVASIRRCRLKDISHRGYFSFTHMLSRKPDVDTYPIIQKMLEDPKFGYYLPRHSMRLGQRDAVALCLMCQDTTSWVKPLAARLATEKDVVALQTIVFALVLAVDPVADKALAAFRDNKEAPAEARAFARQMADVPGTRSKLPKHEAQSTRADVLAMLGHCAENGRLPYDDDSLMQDALYVLRKEDAGAVRAARRRLAGRVSDESLYEAGYLTMLLRSAVSAPK